MTIEITNNMYQCTNCNARGEIKKEIREGSSILAAIGLLLGIVPGIIYILLYMRVYDGCIDCKNKNLIPLEKYLRNNPEIDSSILKETLYIHKTTIWEHIKNFFWITIFIIIAISAYQKYFP